MSLSRPAVLTAAASKVSRVPQRQPGPGAGYVAGQEDRLARASRLPGDVADRLLEPGDVVYGGRRAGCPAHHAHVVLAQPVAQGGLGRAQVGVTRPVLGLIGDGSSQYSVQALWTAAQHKLPIVYVVMRNNEYSILKSFAVLEETPGVPGLDLPGLGVAAMARGWGRRAVDVATTEELEQEFKTALSADTTTVIVVRTQPQKAML
jgi:hypothetical protein